MSVDVVSTGRNIPIRYKTSVCIVMMMTTMESPHSKIVFDILRFQASLAANRVLSLPQHLDNPVDFYRSMHGGVRRQCGTLPPSFEILDLGQHQNLTS